MAALPALSETQSRFLAHIYASLRGQIDWALNTEMEWKREAPEFERLSPMDRDWVGLHVYRALTDLMHAAHKQTAILIDMQDE
jgi:hypothetical protein